MGATLATLVNRVQDNAAEPGIEFSSEAEIKQWIQEAHNRLAETGYLEAQMTASLANGQLKYDVSGWIGSSSDRQIWQLINVEVRHDAGTAWYRLRPKSFDEIRRQIDGTEITNTSGTFDSYAGEGNPNWYCWHGQYLYLWPPPSYDEDVALRLTFYAIELIDDDTDATHLPPKGEDAVITYCLAMRAAKDGDKQTHNYRMNEFERLSREMQGWYNSNRSTYPEMIAPSQRRGLGY